MSSATYGPKEMYFEVAVNGSTKIYGHVLASGVEIYTPDSMLLIDELEVNKLKVNTQLIQP